VIIHAAVCFPADKGSEAAGAGVASPLGRLYTDMDKLNLQPLWTQNRSLLTRQPRPRAIPWLWRHAEYLPIAERSRQLITLSRGGDRRVLAMANPGLGGAPFATPTLWAAIQYLGAREKAPGHRHTPGAIRFVLEGSGTFTTVDGDACDMHPGDLILTPPWRWHDHVNTADTPMIWFDGLDLPLVSHLDAIFFEQFPDELMQPVTGHNLSEARYGGRATVPSVADAPPDYSPLLVYRYEDVSRTLDALAATTGEPLASVEYVNPLTGSSVMPTMACFAHRLAPARRTPTTRTVGSSVFVAYRGAGRSTIDGTRFEWQAGDIFAVPSWAAVDHESEHGSELFSVSDAPVIKALRLFRETVEDAPQEIVRAFGDLAPVAQASP
jgi:gentisate 1,2-dioxygenase